MMRRIFGLTAAAALLLAIPGATQDADPASPQDELDDLIEVVRKDVRAGKSELIAQNMGFDASEAAEGVRLALDRSPTGIELVVEDRGDVDVRIIQPLDELLDVAPVGRLLVGLLLRSGVFRIQRQHVGAFGIRFSHD